MPVPRSRIHVFTDETEPLIVYERPAWHAEAACRGRTRTMFPEGKQGVELAQLFCESCSVRAECGEAGAGEDHGVWGGVHRVTWTRPHMQRRYAEKKAS